MKTLLKYLFLSTVLFSISCTKEKTEKTVFLTKNYAELPCKITLFYGSNGESIIGTANPKWEKSIEEYDGVGFLKSQFFETRDSIYFEYSDGKKLKFYPRKYVMNQDGVIVVEETPYLIGSAGIQYFPINNIKDYSNESAWDKNCDKNEKNCTYTFELTNEYYLLAE